LRPPARFSLSTAREQILKLVRFGAVGALSTVLYLIATSFTIGWLSWPPLRASTAGYLIAMCGSYFGHKILTFRSDAPHQRAIPRFLIQAAIGYAITQGIIYGSGKLGLTQTVGVGVASVALPILNFLVLQFWVFATGSRHHLERL